MQPPHLDVLFEDEFSRFVADGLKPEIVVNASADRINLGVRSQEGTVDVFVGDLSASEAESLADTLKRAASDRSGDGVDGGTWTPVSAVPGDGNTSSSDSDRS